MRNRFEEEHMHALKNQGVIEQFPTNEIEGKFS